MQWGVNNVQLGGRGGGAKAGRRLGGINDLLLTVLKKFQNIKMAEKCLCVFRFRSAVADVFQCLNIVSLISKGRLRSTSSQAKGK